MAAAPRPPTRALDLTEQCRALPAPVRRYLLDALGSARGAIASVRMTQQGLLRTDPASTRWMPFNATHQADPPQRCFSWDARVRIAPLIHLHVRDAYRDGIGSGRVQLLSLLTLAADRDSPELNAGALHRYLAESAWYPSALLPAAGVRWSPIDDRCALASLTDAGTTVSLEFRFNEAGELGSVYTPSRFRRIGTGYQLAPWEGRFSDWTHVDGLRVPRRGEVGWHGNGQLDIVWRGQITAFDFSYMDWLR